MIKTWSASWPRCLTHCASALGSWVSMRKRTRSSAYQHRMVHVLGGVFQASKNVFAFEKWKILQNLLLGGASSQHVQNIFHTKSKAANTRASPALFWVERDAGSSKFQVSSSKSCPKVLPKTKLGEFSPGVIRFSIALSAADRCPLSRTGLPADSPEDTRHQARGLQALKIPIIDRVEGGVTECFPAGMTAKSGALPSCNQ